MALPGSMSAEVEMWFKQKVKVWKIHPWAISLLALPENSWLRLKKITSIIFYMIDAQHLYNRPFPSSLTSSKHLRLVKPEAQDATESLFLPCFTKYCDLTWLNWASLIRLWMRLVTWTEKKRKMWLCEHTTERDLRTDGVREAVGI